MKLDERGLRLAAVAHVPLEALALADGVVALAAAAALVGVVVGLDLLLDEGVEDRRVGEVRVARGLELDGVLELSRDTTCRPATGLRPIHQYSHRLYVEPVSLSEGPSDPFMWV